MHHAMDIALNKLPSVCSAKTGIILTLRLSSVSAIVSISQWAYQIKFSWEAMNSNIVEVNILTNNIEDKIFYVDVDF
jgi:hypothetical protein